MEYILNSILEHIPPAVMEYIPLSGTEYIQPLYTWNLFQKPVPKNVPDDVSNYIPVTANENVPYNWFSKSSILTTESAKIFHLQGANNPPKIKRQQQPMPAFLQLTHCCHYHYPPPPPYSSGEVSLTLSRCPQTFGK